MDAVCTRTRGIRKIEILKFVADFEVNKSWNWEIKQNLPHLQPAGEQNRFPIMLRIWFFFFRIASS